MFDNAPDLSRRPRRSPKPTPVQGRRDIRRRSGAHSHALAVVLAVASLVLAASTSTALAVEAGGDSTGRSARDYAKLLGSQTTILGELDKATEEQILDNLEERDPDLAEQIRQLMFVFDDLAKIDDRGIQEIIKNIQQTQASTTGKRSNGGQNATYKVVLRSPAAKSARKIPRTASRPL